MRLGPLLRLYLGSTTISDFGASCKTRTATSHASPNECRTATSQVGPNECSLRFDGVGTTNGALVVISSGFDGVGTTNGAPVGIRRAGVVVGGSRQADPHIKVFNCHLGLRTPASHARHVLPRRHTSEEI